MVAVAAATANAVAAALAPLGIEIRELPLSPANLRKLLRDTRDAEKPAIKAQ
jgi:aerobic carbon-monoxide dehydrogenase large subunit